jgi:hypothetical protein
MATVVWNEGDGVVKHLGKGEVREGSVESYDPVKNQVEVQWDDDQSVTTENCNEVGRIQRG